jgi:hypothetical protein
MKKHPWRLIEILADDQWEYKEKFHIQSRRFSLGLKKQRMREEGIKAEISFVIEVGLCNGL